MDNQSSLRANFRVRIRKCFKQEEWEARIKECQSSGITVTVGCDLNGISEQTYYRNLQKSEEFCENLLISADTLEKPVSFKKLEVMTLLSNTKVAVIIRLSNANFEIDEGAN